MSKKHFFSKLSLKNRILLLTLLPSLLITSLLTSYLIIIRQSDVQDELIRQITSTINYLSKSSELGLFSGNKEALRDIAKMAETNTDVNSITFFDGQQQALLTISNANANANIELSVKLKNSFYKEELGSKWLFQMPVYNAQTDVEDFPTAEERAKSVQFLGWVQIIANKKRLQLKQKNILLTGGAIGIFLFIIFALSALRLSRNITIPLDKITTTVQKLEAGDLSARVNVSATGELEILVNGINRLSEGVEASNEQLQKRVDRAVIKLTQTLDQLEDKNNKLIKTGKELVEANKSKDAFLASMSHELRTPLTSILGYSRLLKKTNLDEKQENHTSVIHQASTMLLSLIDNILDFSKLKSDSIKLDHCPFSLESLLEDIFDLHLPEAEGKGIKLLIKVDLDVPFDIIGDELRIKQVINNLVRNSIKFTAQGGVTLTASLLQNTDNFGLQFKVKDTGIGMNKPSELFQPYYQADSSITRRFGGTGLGLMICKRLVDLFSGDIHISSTKGVGTTVIFSIRKIDKQEENKETSMFTNFREIIKPNVLAEKTILIAEDNLFIKGLLEMILQSEGAHVISVDNGERAVKEYQKHPFDLVMLDYNMPLLNGYEASKLIKESPSQKKTPVFLITADILNIKDLDLKNVGIDEIIYKPINEQKLLQEVIRYTTNIKTPLVKASIIPQKVLDFLPDEVVFKELERLFKLLQNAALNNKIEDIKKHAHEICGIAGPNTKYQEIEIVSRDIEKSIAKNNYNNIEVLIENLKVLMDK